MIKKIKIGATGWPSFVLNLGIQNAFFFLISELMAAISAIEIGFGKGWMNLWWECDSLPVLHAFKKHHIVPWKIRNRWLNIVQLTKSINFLIGHIYHEKDTCTDRLVSHDITLDDFCWWHSIPPVISLHFVIKWQKDSPLL